VVTINIKRSLHIGNQIDSWTIFSRAATRSHMKVYTAQKTVEITEI